jgi:hypothetical protein
VNYFTHRRVQPEFSSDHCFPRSRQLSNTAGYSKVLDSPVANGLYSRPPQLATDRVEDDPEGFSFCKIKHGIRWTGMPSWKGTLTDQQIWTLALFLKHMDQLPPAAEQDGKMS